MSDSKIRDHRGITTRTSLAVSSPGKSLPPRLRLLLRLLTYVPDSHPVATNTLRACDFLLLLLNICFGMSEVVHGKLGFVSLGGLLLLLLYAVIHCIAVVLELVKFIHTTEK